MASIMPPKRPQMTRQAIEALAKAQGVTGKVYIVAERGHFRDSMGKPGVNDINIYDDACWLVGPDYFQSFNWNTDPSRGRPGIATLSPGVHPYKDGNHGISRPGGGYPALRPATPGEMLPCMRDGKPDTCQAANIHRGGNGTTSSEACQTCPPSQWAEFYGAQKRLKKQHGQKIIEYCLVVKPPVK